MSIKIGSDDIIANVDNRTVLGDFKKCSFNFIFDVDSYLKSIVSNLWDGVSFYDSLTIQ